MDDAGLGTDALGVLLTAAPESTALPGAADLLRLRAAAAEVVSEEVFGVRSGRPRPLMNDSSCECSV